jgi:hypothetical protein
MSFQGKNQEEKLKKGDDKNHVVIFSFQHA